MFLIFLNSLLIYFWHVGQKWLDFKDEFELDRYHTNMCAVKWTHSSLSHLWVCQFWLCCHCHIDSTSSCQCGLWNVALQLQQGPGFEPELGLPSLMIFAYFPHVCVGFLLVLGVGGLVTLNTLKVWQSVNVYVHGAQVSHPECIPTLHLVFQG